MGDYHDAMREFRKASRLSPEAARRVRARVEVSSSRPRWGWLLPVAAVAAAALLTVQLWPEGARPVEQVLDSEVAVAPSTQPATDAAAPRPQAVAVSDDVHLAVQGRGRVTGDTRDVHVAWESGTIGVEVTPEQGIQLEVRTDEARVRVVGTGFDVTRDALGTSVSVSHGRVEVVCEGGDSAVFLGVGESRVCLPRTAGGMLGRARALQDQGAALSEQAAAVTAGIALAEPGPVLAELRGLNLDVLLRQGDNDGALALAERMLADGDPVRRGEALAVAARIHVLNGDCAGADAWLRELAAAGALPADDPARAACPTSFAQ